MPPQPENGVRLSVRCLPVRCMHCLHVPAPPTATHPKGGIKMQATTSQEAARSCPVNPPPPCQHKGPPFWGQGRGKPPPHHNQPPGSPHWVNPPRAKRLGPRQLPEPKHGTGRTQIRRHIGRAMGEGRDRPTKRAAQRDRPPEARAEPAASASPAKQDQRHEAQGA